MNRLPPIYGGQMDKLTQAEKDRINENLGLNQPVIIRYGNWLAEVSHGNFGYSYANGQNVGKMIKELYAEHDDLIFVFILY